ncbi:MAG: hypothetical protein PVH29_06070 [Candidatus Zixiibacteriota bacterium]|jgi:hypothetical protein
MATPKDHDLCIATKKVILDNAAGIPAKDIAAAMGWSEFKLYELADPESTRHIWITDAISLFFCGGRDPRLFEEACRKVGGVFVDLKQYAGRGAEADLADVLREAGDFCSKAAAALGDGKVTASERDRLDREGAEAIAAIVAFLGRAGVTF